MANAVIHKYVLPKNLIGSPIQVTLPKDAKILSGGMQNYSPVIWALIDPTQYLIERTFLVHFTGHHIEQENIQHISTVQFTTPQNNDFVFHIFEII